MVSSPKMRQISFNVGLLVAPTILRIILLRLLFSSIIFLYSYPRIYVNKKKARNGRIEYVYRKFKRRWIKFVRSIEKFIIDRLLDRLFDRLAEQALLVNVRSVSINVSSFNWHRYTRWSIGNVILNSFDVEISTSGRVAFRHKEATFPIQFWTTTTGQCAYWISSSIVWLNCSWYSLGKRTHLWYKSVSVWIAACRSNPYTSICSLRSIASPCIPHRRIPPNIFPVNQENDMYVRIYIRKLFLFYSITHSRCVRICNFSLESQLFWSIDFS